MRTDPRAAIAAANTALGIEFGSTRIKAVLIGPDHEVLATGGHGWENYLEGGLWSYRLDEVVAGLQSAYASLVADVRERYDVTPTSYGSIGISAMMHGYLAFDADDSLLAPFRTWRNTNTGRAADELTRLFGFNIPLRWSIAHLHQAVLDSEEHAPRVAHLTTLAGWVHYRLTGRRVLGVGDASGMFPIDSQAGTYVEFYLDQYEALVATRVPWRLREVLPTVLGAGEDAGTLTHEGAALIDPTGTLQHGIAMCPPEGDAGTGMIATNAIAQRTGNISCGTSVFLMAVLERSLAELHTEIDMVTTPDGSPVAMVHSNNGASELDAWVGWFADFARVVGADVSVPAILQPRADRRGRRGRRHGLQHAVRRAARRSGGRAAGVHAHRRRARDPRERGARPAHEHLRGRAYRHILREEGVRLDSLFAHGGLFKTPGVAQQILADSLNIPVSVGDTAGEGGAWGIAVLARYRALLAGGEAGLALPEYLSERVFAGASVATLESTVEGVAGYERSTPTARPCPAGRRPGPTRRPRALPVRCSDAARTYVYPKMSHVIPLDLFQTLKSDRWNSGQISIPNKR